MQRLLILIVALSLVIGTQSVCPIYKGKKCGGTQSHILRGKTFDAKHGECVQNGDKEECECETGFSGPDCGTHGCSKTLNDCSGESHGTCLDPGLELQNPDVMQSAKNVMKEFPSCVCKPGFTGEACAEKTCTPACAHGTCLNGFCHCNFGYAGVDCNTPACGAGTSNPTSDTCANSGGGNKCDHKDLPIGTGGCSGHGVCTMPQAGKGENVHCVCNSLYEGVLCTNQKELTNCDSATSDTCSGHGNCVADSADATKGRCVCTAGYKGKDCSEQICKDACNSDKKQGVCDSRLRACVCKKGFTGESCEQKDCGGTIRKRSSTGLVFVTQCNGHGTCGNDLKCACDENHKGDDCSEELCPNKCNGQRGECKVDGDKPKACHCKKKFRWYRYVQWPWVRRTDRGIL